MWHSDRLTVEQAAALLGVSSTTIRERINDCTIPAHRVRIQGGDVYLIERRDIELSARATLHTPPIGVKASDPTVVRSEQAPRSLESRLESPSHALATAAARQQTLSNELAHEQARRAELEQRVQQLEEKLAASQEQIIRLAQRNEGIESARRADAASPSCPFLGLSNTKHTRLCLSPEREIIAISHRYADAMCLTTQHRGCSLFLHASEQHDRREDGRA